jgi:AraC family transcriptional regulator
VTLLAGPPSAECDCPRLGFGEVFGEVTLQHQATELAIREFTAISSGCVPRHSHEYPHFCLIVSGQFETTTENLRGRCPPSTLLFHPAGTTHEDRFVSRTGTALVVSVSPGMTEGLGSRGQPAASIALPDAQVGFPGARIRAELRAPDSLSASVIEGLVLDAFARMLPEGAVRGSGPPGWLGRAIELLRSRATEPARVSDIASEVGIHPVHLARVFRQQLDLTPGEYLRRVRVDVAMKLIEHSTDPLSWIAASSGFSDQSELTRAFQRELRCTPAAYRRAMRR